jgi:4-aminobutyrate--pyruvate transaminase
MLRQSEKIGVFAHGYTYTGHPVGCAAALKTIEIYKRDKIIEHVQKIAPVFAERIRRLDQHPLVGSTRSVGLLGGVELVADKKSRRLFDVKKSVGVNCVSNLHRLGVINRAVGGDVIAFCPPLVITAEEVNAMFDIMERALDETQAWVHKNNLRAA